MNPHSDPKLRTERRYVGLCSVIKRVIETEVYFCLFHPLLWCNTNGRVQRIVLGIGSLYGCSSIKWNRECTSSTWNAIDSVKMQHYIMRESCLNSTHRHWGSRTTVPLPILILYWKSTSSLQTIGISTWCPFGRRPLIYFESCQSRPVTFHAVVVPWFHVEGDTELFPWQATRLLSWDLRFQMESKQSVSVKVFREISIGTD